MLINKSRSSISLYRNKAIDSNIIVRARLLVSAVGF